MRSGLGESCDCLAPLPAVFPLPCMHARLPISCKSKMLMPQPLEGRWAGARALQQVLPASRHPLAAPSAVSPAAAGTERCATSPALMASCRQGPRARGCAAALLLGRNNEM